MISGFYMFLALGAACGGFVNGLAGFGTALFQRIQSDAFRRLLIIMMLISGCVLVLRNLA